MMDKIRIMAAFNIPDDKIAYIIDVAAVTFEKWKKNEFFYGLIKSARENPLDVVENSLFLRANGVKVTKKEVYLDADGKKTGGKVVEENLPPDTGACIAILANKRPDKWRRDPDKGGGLNIQNSQVVVLLPDVEDEGKFLEKAKRLTIEQSNSPHYSGGAEHHPGTNGSAPESKKV
jgi:hypothetical protein